MAQRISDCSLDTEHACRIVSSFNGEKPYGSVFEFIQALAALTAVFKDEVQNKTDARSKKLKDVLASAAAPDRIQWYFNNLRMRHALPSRYWSLLSSGTSPNEALHAELNKWFRNQPELYISTLILQLRVNQIAKLIVHNSAMHRPLLRLHNHHTLLIALAWNWEFEIGDAWSGWVDSQASLPLCDKMRETKQALRAKNVPRRVIGKRPVSVVNVRRSRGKKTKRTAIKLNRVKVSRAVKPHETQQ